MSYDKYIKYKNKYLQLKAKYTQVGGNLKWVIDNVFEHGEPATTQITKEESALLVLNSTSGKEQVIEAGHLINERGQKLKNEEGEMNYEYVINADGRTGSRSSKKGTYKMTLKFISDDTPRASAPPLSMLPQRSASGASAYAPPATPPPPASGPTLGSIYESSVPDATIPLSNFKYYGSRYATDYHPPSASGAYAPPPPAPLSPLLLQKLGPLPSFMELGTVEMKDRPRYRTLTVNGYDIGYLQPNNILKKDEATFIRVNDEQINMTFRDNVYPLKPTAKTDVWVYNYDFIV